MPSDTNPDLAREVVSRMPRPGFIKRLLVMVYDGLLTLGVVFLASMVALLLSSLLLPEAFFSEANQPWIRAIKACYFVGASFLFYGWFWTHGGQTLGMRVWHLHLVDEEGKYITWPKAAQRFVLAIVSWIPLGLGFTWILLNKKRAAWHDTLSKTSIVRVAPKK